MELQTIVVGYDGSPDARAALEAAADLAGESATIHVLSLIDPLSANDMAKMMAILPDEFKTGFDVSEGSRGRLQDAEMLLGDRGVDHAGSLVEGKPATAILDAAEALDADLVVVGSRGLGRGTRFLRGSVSSRIANHARCSFLVVHTEE